MPAEGMIICYSDLDKNQMYYNAISGLEKQLQNFIRNNEVERAFSVIDKVFVKLENVSAVSVDFNYSLLVSNIICLVKDEGFLSQFTQIVGRIEDKNVSEMKKSLYKLVEIVASQLKDKKNYLLQKDRVDEIMQYVSENYTDVNLNVSQVSYHFGISSRYLSKQFTEHTGVSLLDFINKTRVSQAKKLLIEQNFTEREIAQKVGFTNGAGFIRIFKQCEGITPGQYRKLNK